MKKKYTLIPNKKQIKIMKEAWKQFMVDYENFWKLAVATEKWMQDKTSIRDLEFIKDEMFGGEWIGIGNVSRTMPLYQREKLEGK